MTKDVRHLLTAAYSGLALIVIAAWASVIRVTLNPEAASTSLMVAWGSVNLAAWGWGWVSLRREPERGFGQLLVALGDLLLPLNLYMAGLTSVKPIATSIPFSASFAAMLALVYYIFADLAVQRLPLTGSTHQAYLFTVCFAVPIYFTHFTIGFSFAIIALMLLGVAGLVAVISHLLDPPLRRHYAVAGMLLIFALVGLFARSYIQRADGLLLLGVYLAAGLLFALTWLNREAWFSRLLGFSAWAVLTLAFASTLHLLSMWQTVHLVLAAVWVALLMCLWGLLGQEQFAPLKESAYWAALALSGIVVGSLWPLWRHLAALHLAGLLTYRFTAASSLTFDMPPDNLWRVLALILIAIAWAGGTIIKRTERAPATNERLLATAVDSFISTIPPLLLLAVISTAAAGVFGAVSWVVALLIVTGAVYCWAGSQSERPYPSRPFTILGYVALVLAVITASYHLPTTLFALAAVALILFIVSEWSDSLTAYVLCLIHLVGGFLLISFGIFPQRSVSVLALSYLLLLLFAGWWVYRARGAKASGSLSTQMLLTLTRRPTEPFVEIATETVLTKTLVTVTCLILLAAFIIAASIRLRQFHPITFLFLAFTYPVIRYAWESAWTAPTRRYTRWVWLMGSEVAHVAVGLLLYSALRLWNVRPDFYGVAFAGLSGVYLIGYLVSSRKQRPLTRMSLMHFALLFSLAAVILAILYCPLGIKAVLAWLLVMVMHLVLSTDDEAKRIYPVLILKILGPAAIVMAAVYLLWRGLPDLAVRVPLPEILTRDTSALFRVSFLFALGLIFTILMNRDKSLSKGLLALVFIITALALVAFVAAPGSVPLYSAMLYVYLLALSRVGLHRTGEETFSLRLPWMSLWLANGLLLLLVGISALQFQFDPLSLLVVTVGFMTLSLGWEQMLPTYVRQRFGRVLLTAYILAHVAAAATVYAFLRAYGVMLSYYGLAFAVLAAMHLLGYWLVRRHRTAQLREKVLCHFGHYWALISLIVTLAFASRRLNGALATLLLALMSLVSHLLGGRAVYKHVAAYFLIAAIAVTGRTWSISLLEFYLIPLAMYFGWVFYRRESRGVWAYGRMGEQMPHPPHAPTPPRFHASTLLRLGLAVGIFLILIAYPAWQFTTTGGLVHLILSGLGAVAAIHLFVLTRVHPLLIYLIGLVLILEAISIIGARQLDSLKVASLIGIGFLIIADLGYLAKQKSVKTRNERIEG